MRKSDHIIKKTILFCKIYPNYGAQAVRKIIFKLSDKIKKRKEIKILLIPALLKRY